MPTALDRHIAVAVFEKLEGVQASDEAAKGALAIAAWSRAMGRRARHPHEGDRGYLRKEKVYREIVSLAGGKGAWERALAEEM